MDHSSPPLGLTEALDAELWAEPAPQPVVHERRPFQPKVYIILQRNNVAHPGEPNERVLAVRLTASAAQLVIDEHPGTRVEKHIASK